MFMSMTGVKPVMVKATLIGYLLKEYFSRETKLLRDELYNIHVAQRGRKASSDGFTYLGGYYTQGNITATSILRAAELHPDLHQRMDCYLKSLERLENDESYLRALLSELFNHAEYYNDLYTLVPDFMINALGIVIITIQGSRRYPHKDFSDIRDQILLKHKTAISRINERRLLTLLEAA